ncbi:protein kinase domain-containing protein [Aspergillus affinis]|uniref:protein kinase domain-containing protein n=1 Tax=Aspergillus affinis TaxID=1070780 RepID=UPI0022FE880C|nr:kinase-like protein [Aspergillus affinis]KAI9045544.1 kinase-like protein [Aspergillus affinis]
MPSRLSIRTTNHEDHTSQVSPSKGVSDLTPPVTPTAGNGKAGGKNYSATLLSPVETKSQAVDADIRSVSEPLQYSDDLEYHYDPKGRPVEFGSGVWSIVYEASSRPRLSSSLITPPSSPMAGGHLVAVKSPARRDARQVLDAEALTLTRLSMMPGSEAHVIPFHGYIAKSHSIVMSAVPLSFSSYIEEKAVAAKKHLSTKTMFGPIQGLTQWHDLAERLITGLHWLHTEPKIIHGDIKPHNILLQPQSDHLDSTPDKFPFDPLFADFSSAHNIAGPSLSAEKHTGTSLTALTPPFAAPELLSVSSLTSPDSAPTTASDVFSLAVTLLAAATGDLLLYPGTSNMQRLAMAREGHQVIEFARSGPNGARIPHKGIVEQIIKPAITKDPAQRISPGEWLKLVQSLH